MMKVKARTVVFSVPNLGHVKILRNGRIWEVLLLKIRRTIRFPCFQN
uniref:Uncharacterized protein n=1 Tax=Arundo donax TaxID=35708 RepID=A0A0A9EAY5_ARUDO